MEGQQLLLFRVLLDLLEVRHRGGFEHLLAHIDGNALPYRKGNAIGGTTVHLGPGAIRARELQGRKEGRSADVYDRDGDGTSTQGIDDACKEVVREWSLRLWSSMPAVMAAASTGPIRMGRCTCAPSLVILPEHDNEGLKPANHDGLYLHANQGHPPFGLVYVGMIPTRGKSHVPIRAFLNHHLLLKRRLTQRRLTHHMDMCTISFCVGPVVSWSERPADNREVTSSNLVRPTTFCE